jgi:glycosyltransferase involved in cell wall biosynthesis
MRPKQKNPVHLANNSVSAWCASKKTGQLVMTTAFESGRITDEMPNEALDVSVVIPCLNEAQSIAFCIDKATAAFKEAGIRGEVVVADNGSTDGSIEIACKHGALVIHAPLKGYGHALRKGIEQARGKFIVIGDADDSYDFLQVPRFVAKWREGYEVVMGNRFKGEIKPGAMRWYHKYLGNPVLSGILNLFFRANIGDAHCGMRGFTKEVYERMDLRTTGMEFASELVVKAANLGARMTEIPITLWPDKRGRPPHLRSFRDGWRHLRFLLLYSPRWLFLYPGAVLMLIGGFTGLWLLPGPRVVGRVMFDVHTLLYSAVAVLLGFQAVSFAVFAKIFAITEGLLPEDPRMNRLFRIVTLEMGLIIGGVLMIIGLVGSIFAVSAWGIENFGPLDPTKTLRLVIPAVVLITLGCQIMLSSFFLSLLGMSRK